MTRTQDPTPANDDPDHDDGWLGLLAVMAGAILLIMLGVADTAEAQTPPERVPTVVAEVMNVTEEWAPEDFNFEGEGILAFRYSPDDPDQTNGAFNYSWTPVDPEEGAVLVGNGTHVAVPGRPGWGKFPEGEFNLGGTGDDTFSTANVRIVAWDGDVGAPYSCSVTVNFRILGDHDQCGSHLAPVPGLAVATMQTMETSEPVDGIVGVAESGVIRVGMKVSPDDPNQVNGSFTYTLRMEFPNLVVVDADDPQPVGSDGLRVVDVETDESSRLWVDAQDPMTREKAPRSCRVESDVKTLFAGDGCGDLTGLDTGILPGAPRFPGVNMTQTSEATGLEAAVLGWVLGGFIIFGAAIFGLNTGGGPGAFILGAAGLVLAVFLNLFALWIIVIVFLIVVALVVLSFAGQRGGGGD